MPTPSNLPAPAAGALPSVRDLLGPPPLIANDAADNYDTLFARLTATIAPADVVEEGLVCDAADHQWEIARLRRHKAKLLTACAADGMMEILTSLNVGLGARGAARGWAARDLATVAEVDALLANAGLDIDHVMARTLALHIAEIEKIDRMIAGLEARRAATLREIAHHRAEAAARRRAAAAAVEQVTDGEFAEVAPTAAPALTHTLARSAAEAAA